jgi:hypothetical protein
MGFATGVKPSEAEERDGKGHLS